MQAWLDPLYAADEMRALDRWAIEERGIPSLDLMERAGTGVAARVRELGSGGPVRIVCGKGNNGGDGLVAARRLRDLGTEPEVLLLSPAAELSDDARANHERLLSSGGSARDVGAAELSAALEGSEVIVDALLGTGFTGSPRAPVDAAIAAVNGTNGHVLAIDVPSGVDASTGEVAGACVDAATTVTFHAAKIGLWIHPGKSHAGRVEVIDIGIPDDPPTSLAPRAGLITPEVLGLVPRRGRDSTKFSAGSVLVLGGSTGLTGAVCLTCDAAMRAGAGWVRAAVPRSLNVVFEQKLTEVMTVPLDDDGDGHLAASALKGFIEAADRADAAVIGPGLGRTSGAFELARSAVGRFDGPLLIDADGINALAQGLEPVAGRTAPTVLTPHAGELARLLGTESAEVAAKRLAHAREAVMRTGATVVLKGDDTLVIDPGGGVAVNPNGSAALATAGTGDVLSGVLGSFLAKSLDAFDAACAAVHAHAQAGWVAASQVGADSVIAGDVIAALPAALRRPAGAETAGG
jgi:ADP-dependent NAD(P)H-hydrate dehydratase / NAD(P)H-hydrate epimerase